MSSFTFEVISQEGDQALIQFNEKRFKTNGTRFFVTNGQLTPVKLEASSGLVDLVIYLREGKTIIEDPTNSITFYEGTGKYVHVPRRRICCYQNIYCYFQDYIESFRESLNLGHTILFDDMRQIRISPYHWYFFLQYPHPSMGSNCFLINTEQLTRPQYLNQARDLLSRGIGIIDYSQENLHLLKDISGTKLWLPYQYNSEEMERLNLPQKKEFDVVFVGTLSPARSEIISRLVLGGTQVIQVKGWNGERDRDLVRGKLLLNIHYNKEYGLYESIRCDRLIFAGVPVITEDSLYQEQLDIKELLIIEPYDRLVEKTQEVLKDYDQVRSEFLEKRERLLSRIIENRKRQLKSLDTLLRGPHTT